MPDASQLLSLMTGPLSWHQGWQQAIYPAEPAQGADLVYTCSGEYRERLLMVSFNYSTSSASTGRYLWVQWEDGNGVTLGRWYSFGEIMANVYCYVTASHITNSSAIAESVYIEIAYEDIIMEPGWSLRVSALNKDAGDQFENIAIVSQRFQTNVVPQIIPAQ